MSLTRAERFDSSSSTPSAGNGADHFETFLTPREDTSPSSSHQSLKSAEMEAANRRLSTTSSIGTPSAHAVHELRKQMKRMETLLKADIQAVRKENQSDKAEQRNDITKLQEEQATLRDVVMTNIMKTEIVFHKMKYDVRGL